jgi:hypothetical protein
MPMSPAVRDPHLIAVQALRGEHRPCEMCLALAPATAPHGIHWKKAGVPRRPRDWQRRGRAYHHPNPLRTTLILWRCERHATVSQVPVNPKEGLGGGVYR